MFENYYKTRKGENWKGKEINYIEIILFKKINLSILKLHKRNMMTKG